MYNQLEFWNLNQVKPIKRTRLAKEGPGSISEVGSFYYHHADTIFMISQYALNITNADGQSSFSTRINQSNTALRGINFDALQIYPDLMHSAPVYYNAAEKALYVPVKPFGSEFNKSYYTNPICARILLPDYEVELLPVYYPEAYQSKWFGMMDKPNITFLNEKIIFNFKFSSNIYVYDKNTGTTTMHNAPSAYTQNEGTPLSPHLRENAAALNDHVKNNPMFLRVIPDVRHERYYRLHIGGNVPGQTRRSYLMIFDANFNIILEHLIEHPHAMRTYVATPQGLILHKIKEKEEESVLNYYRLLCAD